MRQLAMTFLIVLACMASADDVTSQVSAVHCSDSFCKDLHIAVRARENGFRELRGQPTTGRLALIAPYSASRTFFGAEECLVSDNHWLLCSYIGGKDLSPEGGERVLQETLQKVRQSLPATWIRTDSVTQSQGRVISKSTRKYAFGPQGRNVVTLFFDSTTKTRRSETKTFTNLKLFVLTATADASDQQQSE